MNSASKEQTRIKLPKVNTIGRFKCQTHRLSPQRFEGNRINTNRHPLNSSNRHQYNSSNNKHAFEYNKYYITPRHRYKSPTKDPKKDISLLEDGDYIYKNLHNNQFWNWVHPFEDLEINPEAKQDTKQINLKVLEEFQAKLKSKPGSRVPLVVIESTLAMRNKNK